MSYKTATYVSLAVFLLLAGLYFAEAIEFRETRYRSAIGPGYFPIMLSVLLAVLCVISGLQTLRRQDTHIEIPNIGPMAGALAITALFVIAWYLTEDLFYLLAFLFVLALVTLFVRQRTPRQMALNLLIAALVTGGAYLLFGVVIEVRF